jgi:hypothetical protein
MVRGEKTAMIAHASFQSGGLVSGPFISGTSQKFQGWPFIEENSSTGISTTVIISTLLCVTGDHWTLVKSSIGGLSGARGIA